MLLPSPGDTFENRYEVRSVLGRGATATVFRAFDANIGREVALKILEPGDSGYSESREARFLREARVLASLRDPHSVTMYDHGRSSGGLLFMVFELIGGEDLRALIARSAPLDEASVRHVLRQVLQSLREAHRAGLLHRDIKPANIRVFEYMGDRLRVKVLDFGIARPNVVGTDGITRAGGVVGTPKYMSPEQALGGELDRSSDLFSVGQVVYEMLTGLRRVESREQLRNFPTRLPENANVSPQFRSIVERLIATDPRARFQSAEEVLAALDAPVATGLVDRRRRLALLAVVGLVTSVVSGGVLFAVWSSTTEPNVGSHEPEGVSEVADPTATSGEAAAPPSEDVPLVVVKDDVGVESADAQASRDADAGGGDTRSGGCGSTPQLVDGGWTEGSRIVAGQPRTWSIFVGPDYDPSHAAPLVAFVPDRNRSGGKVAAEIGLVELAEKHGFVLVIAKILGEKWDPGVVDTYFVAEAIEGTQEMVCIDRDRVFAIGNGVGGEVVEHLPCHVKLHAMATVSSRGEAVQSPCASTRRVPLITLNGTKDPFAPLGGGMNCNGWAPGSRPILGLDAKERFWNDAYDCDGKARELVRVGESICRERTCGEGRFVSCRLDGGWGWPGSRPRANLQDHLSSACRSTPADFPVGETIWKFFVESTDVEGDWRMGKSR